MLCTLALQTAAALHKAPPLSEVTCICIYVYIHIWVQSKQPRHVTVPNHSKPLGMAYLHLHNNTYNYNYTTCTTAQQLNSDWCGVMLGWLAILVTQTHRRYLCKGWNTLRLRYCDIMHTQYCAQYSTGCTHVRLRCCGMDTCSSGCKPGAMISVRLVRDVESAKTHRSPHMSARPQTQNHTLSSR